MPLDPGDGALDRLAVLLSRARAIRACLAIAEEKIDLLRDLDLEEAGGEVLARAEDVALEHVPVHDLVNPHRAREELAAPEPALETDAIEAEGTICAALV